jgi:hypothetical protein
LREGTDKELTQINGKGRVEDEGFWFQVSSSRPEIQGWRMKVQCSKKGQKGDKRKSSKSIGPFFEP